MVGFLSMDLILLLYFSKEDYYDIYVDDFFYKILVNEYVVKFYFFEIDCLKILR